MECTCGITLPYEYMSPCVVTVETLLPAEIRKYSGAAHPPIDDVIYKGPKPQPRCWRDRNLVKTPLWIDIWVCKERCADRIRRPAHHSCQVTRFDKMQTQDSPAEKQRRSSYHGITKSFRAFCSTVFFAAVETNLMLVVSVGCVRLHANS